MNIVTFLTRKLNFNLNHWLVRLMNLRSFPKKKTCEISVE